ncbi:MAG: hypothetical protein II737_04980 [Mailhella sp.]|nr:hypothetical protein [Mailhella sp.]
MIDCLIIAACIIAALTIWFAVVSCAARSLHAEGKKNLLFLGLIPPAASLAALLLTAFLFFLTGWSTGWFFWLCAFMLHALAACGMLSLTRLVQKRMNAVPCPQSFKKFLLASSVITLPATAVIGPMLFILPALLSGSPL